MAGRALNMRMLRDLRQSTKVLILYEMLREPGVGQRSLAEALEVTPQAISDYLKHMEEEGLIDREGRSTRPTMQGFQFLQENLQELGDFTYRAMREVNVINTCAAIAGEALKEGDPVVLELEQGTMVARKGKWGPSTGVASMDASAGDDIAVRDLEGMMEHLPGSITIASLPSATEGGTSVMDLEALEERIGDSDDRVIAVLDPVGLVAARKLDLQVVIRFGVDRGAVDAALRGMDVLVLGSRETVGDVIEAVEVHNRSSETRIDYSTLEVGSR